MANKPLTRSSSSLQLLHRSEIPPIYKEPFILSGYRQPECTYGDCLRYTLVLHNEAGNFWTHFIPVWVWVAWIFRLPPAIDLSDPYYYPLLSYWAGACIVHLFSSICHGFACKSSLARDVTTMLDYLGIAIYSFGGNIISFYYYWPTQAYPTVFQYKTHFLCVMVILCSNVAILNCLSLYFWPKYRYLVRAMVVGVAYTASITPWLYRLRVCVMTETDCTPDTFSSDLTNLVATITAGVLFTSKFPECFAPGRFDYFCHSHQFFHIAITVQTTATLYALPTVALERHANLMQIPNFSVDFYTTILPHLAVVGVGMATMCVLGMLVSKGQLISHRMRFLQNRKTK